MWFVRNWRVTLGVVMIVFGLYWLFTGDGRLLHDVKSGIAAIVFGIITIWFPNRKLIFSVLLVWLALNTVLAFTSSLLGGTIGLLVLVALGGYFFYYQYVKPRQ